MNDIAIALPDELLCEDQDFFDGKKPLSKKSTSNFHVALHVP